MARKKSGGAQTGKTPESSDFDTAARTAGLQPQPGLGAVEGPYRTALNLARGYRHTASIDLDARFQNTEPNASRWDYGLGLRTEVGEEMVLWLEPHPASSTGEVQKMLSKLDWLKRKLGTPEFSELHRLNHTATQHTKFVYRWLARTGDIRITPNSKEARQLALAGLDQPRRLVLLP